MIEFLKNMGVGLVLVVIVLAGLAALTGLIWLLVWIAGFAIVLYGLFVGAMTLILLSAIYDVGKDWRDQRKLYGRDKNAHTSS